MIRGHLIQKSMDVEDFFQRIAGFSGEDIIMTDHALFRLQEKDRKVFKERIVREFLLYQAPRFVGIQNNGNYTVFYKYGKDSLKMIIDFKSGKIHIITFYIVSGNQVPRGLL